MKTTETKTRYSVPQISVNMFPAGVGICQTSVELESLDEEDSGITTWW